MECVSHAQANWLQVVLDEETAVHKASRPFIPLSLSLFLSLSLSLSFSLSLRRLPRWTSVASTVPFVFVAVVVARYLESYARYTLAPILQSSDSHIELISWLKWSRFFLSLIRILFYTGAICEPSNNSLIICISFRNFRMFKNARGIKALFLFFPYVYQVQREMWKRVILFSISWATGRLRIFVANST